jgi:hypothetical protein
MQIIDKVIQTISRLGGGEKLKLEKAMLPEMGGEIEADAFEAGQAAFIVTEEDERIALPIGTYEIEGVDGVTSITVDENGVITEVSAPALNEEPAVETEEVQEVEAESQVEEENVESSIEEVEQKATLADQIDEIKSALMTEIMAACDEKYEAKKTNMSSQRARAKRPITPNPEGVKGQDEPTEVQLKRAQTPFDRAIEMINK